MSISADNRRPPTSEVPAISSEEQTVEPLSKKAQKKAAKAARYVEQKAERRAREKEKRKLKRAAAQPEPHDDDDGAVPPSKRVKLDQSSQAKFGSNLVIDLGFDDKMTEKVPSLYCHLVAVVYIFVHRRWYRYLHNSRTHTVQIGRQRVHLNV